MGAELSEDWSIVVFRYVLMSSEVEMDWSKRKWAVKVLVAKERRFLDLSSSSLQSSRRKYVRALRR